MKWQKKLPLYSAGIWDMGLPIWQQWQTPLCSSSEEGCPRQEKSFFLHDQVLPVMGALRAACDDMETITAKDAWPFPTYGELLFGVK